MGIIHNLGLFLIKVFDLIIPKKKNQVLFFSKPDFSDNGRAIYEEFVRQGLDKKYEAVWICNGNPEKLSKRYPGIKFYKKSSFGGLFQYARSSYIFRSHMMYGNVRTKSQKVILSWHGMGIKGPIDFNIPFNSMDYITVSSDFYKFKLATRQHCHPSRCIITGLPRNDFMFMGKGEMCLNNLKKVVENKGCKTLLWMPTYHSEAETGDAHGKAYALGIPVVKEEELELLNNTLKEKNVVLLIKLHPHVMGHGGINKVDYSNIQVFEDKDLPQECSLYHLLGSVDGLMTDYSSVYTDFMLLDRPIAFIYDDFEEYKKKPGFAFERVELMMPGLHMHTTEELLKFIDDFSNGIDVGAEERRTLNKFINFYNDDKNSERLLRQVGLLK